MLRKPLTMLPSSTVYDLHFRALGGATNSAVLAPGPRSHHLTRRRALLSLGLAPPPPSPDPLSPVEDSRLPPPSSLAPPPAPTPRSLAPWECESTLRPRAEWLTRDVDVSPHRPSACLAPRLAGTERSVALCMDHILHTPALAHLPRSASAAQMGDDVLSALALNPRNERVYGATEQGFVYHAPVYRGSASYADVVGGFEADNNLITCVGFSPWGYCTGGARYLYTAGASGLVKLWTNEGPQHDLVATLEPAPTVKIVSVAWMGSETTLATAARNRKISVFDVRVSNKPQAEAAASAQCDRVVRSYRVGSVEYYGDLAEMELYAPFFGGLGGSPAKPSPGRGRTPVSRRKAPPRRGRAAQVHHDIVPSSMVAQDECRLVVGSNSGFLDVFDLRMMKRLSPSGRVTVETKPVHVFEPPILSKYADKSSHPTSGCVGDRPAPPPMVGVTSLAVNGSGTRVFAHYRDSTVWEWDTASYQATPLRHYAAHRSESTYYTNIALSPDDRYLAVSSRSPYSSVFVYDTKSPGVPGVLESTCRTGDCHQCRARDETPSKFADYDTTYVCWLPGDSYTLAAVFCETLVRVWTTDPTRHHCPALFPTTATDTVSTSRSTSGPAGHGQWGLRVHHQLPHSDGEQGHLQDSVLWRPSKPLDLAPEAARESPGDVCPSLLAGGEGTCPMWMHVRCRHKGARRLPNRLCCRRESARDGIDMEAAAPSAAAPNCREGSSAEGEACGRQQQQHVFGGGRRQAVKPNTVERHLQGRLYATWRVAPVPREDVVRWIRTIPRWSPQEKKHMSNSGDPAGSVVNSKKRPITMDDFVIKSPAAKRLMRMKENVDTIGINSSGNVMV